MDILNIAANIIPNDLTLQQKENAVNIINQLRAKNAFPGNDNTSS